MVLNANGDLTSYQKVRDLNRWDYAFGLDLGRSLSARSSARASVHAMTSLTPVLDSGAVALALGPLSRTRSLAGAAGFERRMSTRTALTMTGNLRDVKYSVPGLAGGRQADVTLALQHRPNATMLFGVGVESGHTSLGELGIYSETVAGNWSAIYGSMAYALRAGARMLGGDSVQGAWTPFPLAEGDVSRRVGRFAAHVRGGYAVAPTLGVGSILASRYVGASVDRPSPRGTSIRLSVDRATSHDRGTLPTADTSGVLFRSSELTSLAAGLDVRRSFGLATWVAASAILRRSVGSVGPQGDQRVTSHVVGLGLGRRLF
jgi:hypothetical protein